MDNLNDDDKREFYETCAFSLYNGLQDAQREELSDLLFVRDRDVFFNHYVDLLPNDDDVHYKYWLPYINELVKDIV